MVNKIITILKMVLPPFVAYTAKFLYSRIPKIATTDPTEVPDTNSLASLQKSKKTSNSETMPEIDYRKHPGYLHLTPFTTFSAEKEQEIYDLVEKIDDFIEIADANKLNAVQLRQTISGIRESITEIEKQYLANSESIWASSVFRKVVRFAEPHILYYLLLNQHRFDYSPANRAAKDKQENLQTKGYAVFRIDEAVKQSLHKKAAPYLKELKERASKQDEIRTASSVDFRDAFGRELLGVIKDLNICELHSDHMKYELRIFGCGIEYSVANQIWWQGCYSDVGLADSPLCYMHCDHGDAMPKMMLYLSEVDEQHGPTKYVTGSHNWTRSPALNQIQKSMDQIGREYAGLQPGVRYYRPMRKSSQLRRLLLSLPAKFMGTSHFGDDILPDDPAATKLSAGEFTLLSKTGDVMAFDSRGIHRGSIVSSGDRLACQLILIPKIDQKISRIVSQITGNAFSITM